MRSAPAPDGPLVATLDYVPGFPFISVTPFAFYGEPTAKLLQAVGRCLQSGKVDEVECCLQHALEPGCGLGFDWLVDGYWGATEHNAELGIMLRCSPDPGFQERL